MWNELVSSHPLKEVARGLPVIVAPVVLYSDDTSGNKSKKWNKFDLWAMMLAGLPRMLNSQLEHIHFIICSNLVSALDMAGAIAQDLLKLEAGVITFDAHLCKTVLLVTPVICALCDNPRASELLNHSGSGTRKFCRMCSVSHAWPYSDPLTHCNFRCMHLPTID